MFEAAEVGNAIDKSEYETRVAELRVDLVNAQFDLRTADFPVVVLLAGDDREGRNEVLNVLHEWMDARYLQTVVQTDLDDGETAWPRMRRFWERTPRRGGFAMFVGAWAHRPILEHFTGAIDDEGLDRVLEHVARLEQQLVDDGALLVKIWLHVPRSVHRDRVRDRDGRVEPIDRLLLKHYRRAMRLAERLVRRTSTAAAPWLLVEGTDDRYRNLTVANAILAGIRHRLDASPAGDAPTPQPLPPVLPDLDAGSNVLSAIDLAAAVPDEEYDRRLPKLQRRLGRLALDAREQRVSSVVVFEGWDAAGKGGAIRRITAAMDARDYRVVPIAAPTEEEKAHHYLWRFWRMLPRDGSMVVFDRSWYGRVLVERVEGYAGEAEWRRAYGEIVDFEEQLVEHGIPVVKFWLHVDREEQARRLEARDDTPYKKYKVGPDDYRNRARWDDYLAAADEMVARTSTDIAPWHLVAANDKRFARITVLETLCRAMKRALRDRRAEGE